MNTAQMTDYNLLWAKTILQELAASGIKLFCLSPGARSSALALALASLKDAQKLIHFDERASAFYAQGFVKATGNPAALICTSGTAGANYLPAILEASNAELPLIIITADRPAELHFSGANQTIEQANLYGNFPVWSFDLPTPADLPKIDFVRSITCEAAHQALTKKGPVHLNVRFREPLVQDRLEPFSAPEQPYKQYFSYQKALAPKALTVLSQAILESQKGLIALGELPSHVSSEPILEIASYLNWPVLLDITSGARFSSTSANACCQHDLYLRNSTWRSENSPDCVLRFGGAFTSKFLDQYLAKSTSNYFHISSSEKRFDTEAAITKKISCEYDSVKSYILETEQLSSVGSKLLDVFLTQEKISRNKIQQALQDENEKQWSALFTVFTEFSNTRRAFFIGNSLAIREAEAVVPIQNKNCQIGSNRGASGIDGLIASACGFAQGLAQPITLVIGDLSALHDLNSFSLISKSLYPVIIVIINNNGGAIFSHLDNLSEQSDFEEYFLTPHGLNFEAAALLFGLPYERTTSTLDFKSIYQQTLSSNASKIIEVITDPKQAKSSFQSLFLE